ncbi:MAG: AEC family transporter [Clostridia bacterium]|nr:AEC family transporter [Clostridia bacterium]
MTLFLSTLNQMGVLGAYMLIGFIVAKLGIVSKDASKTLSKLENNVFLPALVLYTFLKNFNTDTLSQSWQLLIFSLVAELIIIPVAIISAKLASKDGFIRRIYTYGLSFSNFGFMGNAVVLALAPAIYNQYVIFTLPLWTLIYIWGVPDLLIEKDENAPKETRKDRILSSLKSFLNPMFIALLIGAIIGITGLGKILLSLNGGEGIFVTQVIKVCGDCMSPIAMMLAGITFATVDVKKILTDISIYAVTLLRLIAYPIVFGGIVWLINRYVTPVNDVIFKCFIFTLAMPLGLNTIVIPAAYGKDTSVPAGMALISHILSIATIPLITMIFI